MNRPCLVLGNGPSLNRLPADVYDTTPSFGMNFAKLQPMYYVCVDSRVLTEYSHEIYDLAKNAEIAYLSSKHAAGKKAHTEAHTVGDIYSLTNVELVWKDHGAFGAERYMSGMTATYVCLKMAYYAGFNEIHLWGVDHSPDWGHYRTDYLPDMAATRSERMREMEWHYTLAMNVYARAGRKIINHSDPSRLDMIFQRAR